MQSTSEIKNAAHRLINTLPDDTSWEELLYTLQVRQDIEAGLQDSEAGYVVDSGKVRREPGIIKDERRMAASLDFPPSADT